MDNLFDRIDQCFNNFFTESRNIVVDILNNKENLHDKTSDVVETWIDRMKYEYKQLENRVNKLSEYLENPNTDNEDESYDKHIQVNAMKIYLDVLTRRLKRALENERMKNDSTSK